ncbi:MAG TPA: pentapeptide repeat-containing protein [Lacipirellulaceae bacterium]
MTKNWKVLVAASLSALLVATAPVARADIFQWEYINPANPSQGKQLSTTLAPDGAGANAVPGAFLSRLDLTMAYLIGANLSGTTANVINLTNADLSQANLTNANFSGEADEYAIYYSDLASANFTNAQVRGAQFSASNLSTAQLYSTASYQAHDLTGIGLAGHNLAGANFAAQNLTNAGFGGATLTNGDFRQANLTNANFVHTTLTSADLTGAEVRGARFDRELFDVPNDGYLGGITTAQLYSTASYQARNLTGVHLNGNALMGVDLADQNLINAWFSSAALTGATFNRSNLTNTYFSSATLVDADLSHANLRNANFFDSRLTGANLTGAEIRGASFVRWEHGMGISLPQLYSTASYQAHDLTGVVLYFNDLSGANLVGQNLTNAFLAAATLTNANLSEANLTGARFTSEAQIADLSGANLSHANLTNAYFAGYEVCGESACGTSPGANLTGANLTGADARGANFYLATLTGANTRNLIHYDGSIGGLDLTSGATLVVRDYDGNPGVHAGVSIVVHQRLSMDPTGTLSLEFDADPWGSTISFAPGIPVALGGTLQLAFAPDVNLASQVGRTIDLFDWTGVTPTGAFTLESPYTWNLSKLYTTGEVTLTALPAILPGDFNGDNTVDAADYVVWRKLLNQMGPNLPADANGDNQVDTADYTVWRAGFGRTTGSGSGAMLALSSADAVPEATSLWSFAIAFLCFADGLRRREAQRQKHSADAVA